MRKRYWLIIASILVLGVIGCNSSDNDSPTEPTSYPVCPTDVTRRWDEPYELSVDFGASNATQTIGLLRIKKPLFIGKDRKLAHAASFSNSPVYAQTSQKKATMWYMLI